MEDQRPDKAVELKDSLSTPASTTLQDEKTHHPVVETKVAQPGFKRCFVCEASFKRFQLRQCQKCHYVVCARCSPELRTCVSCIKNLKLNRMIKDDHEKAMRFRATRMLLFEPSSGDSGTAGTILESMMAIYGSNLNSFIPDIHGSLIKAAQCLVHATGAEDRHKLILGMRSGDAITLTNVDDFKVLWADHLTQEVSPRVLNESAKFFFSRLDAIAGLNYEPTARDVIKWRAQTTGVVQLEFKVSNIDYQLLDVSRMLGTARKKWLACLEIAVSVTFVFALSDYDMETSIGINRLVAALACFEEICKLSWFGPSVILCLTNRDLFEEKLKNVPLKVCPTFSDYQGPQTLEAGIEAIEEEFATMTRAHDKVMSTVVANFDRELFEHFRTASSNFFLNSGVYH